LSWNLQFPENTFTQSIPKGPFASQCCSIFKVRAAPSEAAYLEYTIFLPLSTPFFGFFYTFPHFSPKKALLFLALISPFTEIPAPVTD